MTANIGLDVTTNAGLYGSLTFMHRDAMYFTSDNVNKTAAYDVLNGKIGFQKTLAEHWGLDVYAGAINLTGTQYMVAVATAMVGVIAFVGLIVPHLLRLMRSSDYRFLVPASAIFGAFLMEIVDITARIIIPPAELPIGIITAIVGAPIFIFILIKQQQNA